MNRRFTLNASPPVSGDVAAVMALSEKSFRVECFSDHPCPVCQCHHNVIITFGPDSVPNAVAMCTETGDEFKLDKSELLKLANTIAYWQRGVQAELRRMQGVAS